MASKEAQFAYSQSDTIVAPITAAGQAALAVIRLSGSASVELLRIFSPRAEIVLAEPRKLVISPIFDRAATRPQSAELLDHGLIVFFKAPQSFTGEDVVEFQLHGGLFIVSRLLENLLSFGARLAEPGEFSKRAFLNGQIDLSQAEAIADLIAAESQAQAIAAREQLEGKLSEALSELGEPLRELLAEIEAQLDFPEEDLGAEQRDQWQTLLRKVQQKIAFFIESFKLGRLSREGASVAITGLPNAGKSSLLNRLLGEERAIVSPYAGTTRDSLEERISLDGLFVRLWDSAGVVDKNSLTKQADEVERLSIERSWKQIDLADQVLLVLDGTVALETASFLLNELRQRKKPLLLAVNKVDLLSIKERERWTKQLEINFKGHFLFISALEGQGITELRERLRQELFGQKAKSSAPVLISNIRHLEALQKAQKALEQCIISIEEQRHLEFVAFELRESLQALSAIVGLTCSEDILKRIFSRFCIGK